MGSMIFFVRLKQRGRDRMLKELIITIGIVLIVIVGDILTQNYTEKCVEEMNNELEQIKQSVLNEEGKDEILEKISDLDNNWHNKLEKLVYYLEHDELEKVTTQLYEINGFSEIDEINEAVPKIEESKFLLNHIMDKEKFNFKNIF